MMLLVPAGTACFALARTICIVTMHFRRPVPYKVFIRLFLENRGTGTKLAILLFDIPHLSQRAFPAN
jgi:hypothetical protein